MKKIALILLVALIFYSCKKDATTSRTVSIPTVTTTTVTGITSNTAISGGTVTDDGGDTVRARGVCWDTAANPTIAGLHTSDSSGLGTFTSNITGLNASSTYHIRAYATNSQGTAYGNEMIISSAAPDVYVVGGQYAVGGGNSRATVWKNGIATILTDGTTGASIFSIYVSGADVYLAGYIEQGFTPVATIWKNGVPTALGTAAHESIAKSIVVSGSDVYAVGYQDNGGTYSAMLWKNGVATSLSDPVNHAQAYSVAVSGTDVYVAGFEGAVGGSVDQGKIWKNGVVMNYTADQYWDPRSIFISGSDIYVAGALNTGSADLATTWKNGVHTVLGAGPNYNTAYSVFVSGSDVYAAGYEDITSGFPLAKVWKNGVATVLTTPTFEGGAYSVFVYGSDVYVAGDEYSGTSYQKAMLWKNGVVVPLPAIVENSFANRVLVK